MAFIMSANLPSRPGHAAANPSRPAECVVPHGRYACRPMALVLLAGSKAVTDTIGLAFTWLILLPLLATGLIIVAIVLARGEKRENEKYVGRWGQAAKHTE